MMLDGTPFPKVTSAPEAWDAIPDSAKLQIFAFIGFLEYVSYGYTYNAYMQCHSWLTCFDIHLDKQYTIFQQIYLYAWMRHLSFV
jgi:hypothetical protein